MLDVASLQQFDFFSYFTLYAGAKGVYRTISNVVILDYEGVGGEYNDFHRGDFVITNLLYAKNDPSKIYDSFSTLMSIGVSAIAVKTVFFDQLPQEVVLLAEERNVPIFLFHSIYIEDVLLNITDYLRSKTKYNYYENQIDIALHKTKDETPMNNLLADMDIENYAYVSCMYISSKHPIDDFSLQRMLNGLQQKKSTVSYEPEIFLLKYKKGILFFYFFAEHLSHVLIRQKWNTIFFDFDLKKGQFYIGISDEPVPVKKLSIAIQRSLYSNECCIHEAIDEKSYSELDINNLLLPLSENMYIREYLSDLQKLIQRSGSQQNNHLMETLQIYVQNNFNIDKTAQLLFQHANTIRYRINKIKTLTGIQTESEFQILALLLVRIQF